MNVRIQVYVMIDVILLLSASIAMTVPTNAEQGGISRGGPLMNWLVFKFGGQSQLWNWLKTGEIDLMCAPLTHDQYQEAIQDPNIQLTPIYMNDWYGIAINNNRTISSYPNWRSPTNYTEFRKAIEYCVDKDDLITGPLYGFATRIETPVPLPNMAYWAYLDHPTIYDPAAAAAILDSAGFVQGETPNPYSDPTVPWSAPYLRVYPPGHEKGGQDLDPLIGIVPIYHEPRLLLARQLTEVLRKLGIPVNLIEATSQVIFEKVYLERDYHFYAESWDFTARVRFPFQLQIYMSNAIYSAGPNYINFRDPEYDYWAERFLNATSFDMAREAAINCQKILLDRVASVWVCSSKSYEAYRKGWLHMVNMRGGYGLNNQWTYLFAYNENPNIDALRVGVFPLPWGANFDPMYDPPNEILESVFGHLIYVNPYKMAIPGQSPQGGDQPWLAKDWMYEIDRSNRAHVMFWIESGIVWHDGTPFTAFDVNNTIWLIKSDPTSWYYPYVEHVESTIIHNDYTIEVIFDNPSIWNIYNIGLWIYISKGAAIGTGAWKYGIAIPPPNTVVLEANRNFLLKPLIADINLVYYWDVGEPPRNGSYKVGLIDLVMLAIAYGSRGNPPSLGWEPGCDIAAPSCVIGLSDLVKIAIYYGQIWGPTIHRSLSPSFFCDLQS